MRNLCGIISRTARCISTKRPLTHSLDYTEEGLAMQATHDGSADVVEVPVKAGEVFLVTLMDAADADRLGDHRLSLGSHGYAQMFWDKHVTLVHRWILGLQRGDRRVGDHINGEPLDNRRANLRAVSKSGSSQNVSGRGRSRYRGVYLTRQGRWSAKVKYQGKTNHLGLFATEEDAALAADAKRRELMPDYAGIRILKPTLGPPDDRTHGQRMVTRAVMSEIRTWARARNLDVAEVGRIPGEVVRAYSECREQHPLGEHDCREFGSAA